MKRLVRFSRIAYRQDECEKLRAELNKIGYDASLSDIEDAWEEHSADYSAGWLILDDKPERGVQHLLKYLVEE